MQRPRQNRRKLLVAAVGVATVSYVIACADRETTEGATTASQDASDRPPTSGNLPSPPPPEEAGTPPTSGNLPAPPPPDDDAGDAGDGGGDAGGDAGD